MSRIKFISVSTILLNSSFQMHNARIIHKVMVRGEGSIFSHIETTVIGKIILIEAATLICFVTEMISIRLKRVGICIVKLLCTFNYFMIDIIIVIVE